MFEPFVEVENFHWEIFARDVCLLFYTLRAASAGSTLAHMEVPLTAEEELLLSEIAAREGIEPQNLAKDAVLRLLEEDAQIRAGIRRGIEQADRGELIEQAEMDERFKKMLKR
ncbi:MAG TPA: hypothetical protein VLC94_06755 [Candidatus Acidoferrum sp.]|nr:hypothetical protein [Candidatus Acidoferrum sp.]